MVKDEDHDDIVGELVAMLHKLYASTIDTGGQTDEENEQTFEDARLLLGRHGVEV